MKDFNVFFYSGMAGAVLYFALGVAHTLTKGVPEWVAGTVALWSLAMLAIGLLIFVLSKGDES